MANKPLIPQQLLTSEQLAVMSPSEQANYLSTLSPAARQAELPAADRARELRIRRALAKNIRYVVPAQPQGTTGITATYAVGQQLSFEIPQTGNATATALRVKSNLTATYTPGTTMAENAAFPYSLYDYIQVKMGNLQIRWRPYFFKPLHQMLGALHPAYAGQTFGGYSDTVIEGDEWNVPGTIVSGPNTIFFTFDVPLAPLSTYPGAGLLPISGSQNPIEILLNCAAQPVGNDPLLNSFKTDGSVAMTGTVEVDVEYVAGTTMAGPTKLLVDPLDLIGYPTLQYDMDVNLTPLQSTGGKPQRITKVGTLVYAFACVIDGQQSNHFISANSNLTGIELDVDAAGQTPLWRYGAGSKMPIDAYWHRLRRTMQQDLDPGIYPLVFAPVSNSKNPDNRDGADYLENSPAGWPAVYHYETVTTTGAVTSPRVELAVVILNRQGLQLQEVGPQS